MVMDMQVRELLIFSVKKVKLLKKNYKWVFTSFSGHYSDNPKYISQALHLVNPEIQIVWLVKNEYISVLPEYVHGVIFGSKAADEELKSADIIIDNTYGNHAYSVMSHNLIAFLKKFFHKIQFKDGIKIFTTWHGTPLKKMGRDQIGNEVNDFVCGDITMILGNKYTADIMSHLTFNKIPMVVLGTPRNDLLFENDSSTLKVKLDLPINKKIILFAPTFRNDGKDVEGKNIARSGLNQLNEIDFDRLFQTLKDKFGGDWIMICRFHYHVEAIVNWEELKSKYSGQIVNGNSHDDMAEYLACADILLTDASSSMFDYSITKKPCFLFFPDLEHYRSIERGFYIPVENLPFPVSTTFEDLCQSILEFDNKEYIKNVKTMQHKLGFSESPDSSKRVVKYILSQCQK